MLQLLALCLVLFAAMANAQTPNRSSQSGEIPIHGPIEKVFSLFTPKGELLWIPTWKFDPVLPADGETEENMVFRTDEGSTIWTLARYEPPHTSVYVLMNRDLVARTEVDCRAESSTETVMRTTYIWTALTEKGRHHFVSAADFAAKMARWKGWLDDYSRKQGWMK